VDGCQVAGKSEAGWGSGSEAWKEFKGVPTISLLAQQRKGHKTKTPVGPPPKPTHLIRTAGEFYTGNNIFREDFIGEELRKDRELRENTSGPAGTTAGEPLERPTVSSTATFT
jgi:hypothetical protein